MSHSPTHPALENTAVEVVATLGDAVVGVRHVADPRGGAVRPATKALLAGGAALLATSAIAFGYAAHVADANQAALEAWIARGKPAWSFRPERLPAPVDPLMLGGSILGVAALAYGLSRRRSELAPSRVRLGTAAGADFPVEGVGAAFDLVAPLGAGFAVHVAPGMTGAAPGTHAVTDATRLRLQLGRTTFHVAAVPAPRAHAAAALTLERRPLAFFAASAIAHLGLVFMLRTVPQDQETAAGTSDEIEGVLARAETTSTEDPVVEPSEGPEGDTPDTGGTAGRMALESGTMGAEDQASRDPAKRRVKANGDPKIAKSIALANAQEAGILGSSYVSSGAMFASITGTGDITSGFDDADIYGGWDGTGDGAPTGFGNGPSGGGPGGGGQDWNSVWAGDYRTISRGPGTGDEWGMSGGSCRGAKLCRGRRVAKAPTVKIGKPAPNCSGDADCDPSIIARYIKRNASKIAYCYERELLAQPGLAGTVDTLFTVMPNGTVSQASASGVDPSVSSCVRDVISTIKFPKFNTPFQVKYPFHMRPAGA